MQTRRHAIDGLRGWAAVCVVVYHAILAMDASAVERVVYCFPFDLANWRDVAAKVAFIIFNGEAAVTTFFILSGAVLAESLKREHRFDITTCANFMLRRILRIFPALAIWLVVFFLVTNTLNYFLPGVFPLNFSLDALFENVFLRKITINGATWTVQVEVFVIPLVLVAFAARKLLGITGLAIISVCCINILDRGFPLFNSAMNASVLSFSLGMMIATREVELIVERLPKMAWIYFLISSILVRHILPPPSFSSALSLTLLCAGMVGCVYHNDNVSKFLSGKTSLLLGRISFSFYLINVIFMSVFQSLFVWLDQFKSKTAYLEIGLLLAIATICLTIPLSIFSERWIEQPFIDLGRRMTRGNMRKRERPLHATDAGSSPKAVLVAS